MPQQPPIHRTGDDTNCTLSSTSGVPLHRSQAIKIYVDPYAIDNVAPPRSAIPRLTLSITNIHSR